MSLHGVGTIKTSLSINSILSGVIVLFMGICTFFLVRLISQIDTMDQRVGVAERSIVETRGTLKVLEERTLTLVQRSEKIDQKMDRVWEEVKK